MGCPADNQALVHYWLSDKFFGCADKKTQLEEIKVAMTAPVCEISFHTVTDHLIFLCLLSTALTNNH